MLKLEVFDPAMCCATGICGNSVDPKLVTFAADLEWLKKQGVDVVRYGLSFEPAEFVKNEAVKSTLQSDGNDSLPIIVIDNKIVSKACYPNRKKLAEVCKVNYDEQEVLPVKVEKNYDCGPDCDCHKSSVSATTKKALFITVILAMLTIIGIKIAPKAHSAEVNYPVISSFSQVKTSQEVAFVYVPDNSGKISSKTKSAMLSAKKSLEARNINVELYTLNSASADYSAQTAPAVVVIYKGKDKKIVTGDINTTKLLQAYMAATLAGGCGANCPCHKH